MGLVQCDRFNMIQLLCHHVKRSMCTTLRFHDNHDPGVCGCHVQMCSSWSRNICQFSWQPWLCLPWGSERATAKIFSKRIMTRHDSKLEYVDVVDRPYDQKINCLGSSESFCGFQLYVYELTPSSYRAQHIHSPSYPKIAWGWLGLRI